MRSIALLSCLAVMGFSQPQVQRRIPAPFFSQDYVNALRDVLELEPGDVAKLEGRLAKNPADFAARLKLMAYCLRADRAGMVESHRRRAGLALWLIENQPESEILGSPYAIFGAPDLTAVERQQMFQRWDAALGQHASDARVQWNAAQFFEQNERARYVGTLEKAVALAPENARYSETLGTLYAQMVLTGDRRAGAALEASQSALVLEAAVRMFQNEYNRSVFLGQSNAATGDLARRYFSRALRLDPGMDQAWVLPVLDRKAPVQETAAEKKPAGRTASPTAFPQLPAGIVAALRARRCTVPQTSREGAVNVIRGEFLGKKVDSWAVLCSAGGFSSILVFRGESGEHPEELARREDSIYIQDGVYSRQIQAADGKFILTHYRAYGGPQPPPIDHMGIDDMFLEKASVTYYFYRGKWLELTGSD